MKKNSTYYSWIWEQVEVFYTFAIPPTHSILSDKEFEALTKKMVFFHKEYHRISKKNNIGEILSKELLELKKKNSCTCYLDKIKEYFLFQAIQFFPYLCNEIDLSLRFSSKIFYHNNKSNTVENYIYGMYSNSIETVLCDIEYWKREKNVPENIINFLASSNYSIGDYFVNPIEFEINILSNLFFPFLETAYQKNDVYDTFEGLIDNREIAYLNAPRFNSFLRDLKNLVVNKLGWEFTFDAELPVLQGIKYLTENGILLDDRIIYQEDIEKGYVNMKTYEWIGPARDTVACS